MSSGVATIYARYLPVYILHMLQLPTTHPTAHEQLVAGEFAIQWSKGNTYGRILHDQAIKVTNNNKDAKSHGGIISITLRPAAVFKWMVLGADRAEFTGSSMWRPAGSTLTDVKARHKYAGKKQMQDAVVQRIVAVLENWIEPLESDQQLCHLESLIVSTDEVKTDMLNAHAKGLEALRSFANERLGEDEKMLLCCVTTTATEGIFFDGEEKTWVWSHTSQQETCLAGSWSLD